MQNFWNLKIIISSNKKTKKAGGGYQEKIFINEHTIKELCLYT